MLGHSDPVRRPGRNDAGMVTVWAAGLVTLGLVVLWAGSVLALGIARQHQLDAAADLASLAGASRLQHGGDACAAARRVARANHVANAVSCTTDGADVVVTVHDVLSLPFDLRARLESTARAGPDTGRYGSRASDPSLVPGEVWPSPEAVSVRVSEEVAPGAASSRGAESK